MPLAPMTGREGRTSWLPVERELAERQFGRCTHPSTCECDRLGAMSRVLCGVASLPAGGRRAYTSPARMAALRAHGSPRSRTVLIRSLTGPRQQPSPSPERPTLNVAAVFACARRIVGSRRPRRVNGLGVLRARLAHPRGADLVMMHEATENWRLVSLSTRYAVEWFAPLPRG